MDAMKYKILEDGTISLETDAVSGENHLSAEELIDQLATVMGGSHDMTKKQGHALHHAHGHEHGHSHHHH